MKIALKLLALFVVFQVSAKDFNALLELHQKQVPFKTSFTQLKTVREMGLELRSEGVIEVKKEGHALWQINKPAYLKVEVSPAEIKLYSEPNAKPRVISKSEGAAGDGAWMELLMKKPTDLNQHFEITVLRETKFKLIPKKTGQGFEFLDLEFLKSGKLKEVFIQENKEDSIKIVFGGK